MAGKTALITGVTQGIGRVAARELAKHKLSLVLVARDAVRGAALVEEIKAQSQNPNIELLIGDLSSLADVRRIAAEFKARHRRLDLLINNAGAIFSERKLSVDGYEMTFALNHLAYFLLTELLLDVLKTTARAADNPDGEARVINVASNAHKRGQLNFDDLMGSQGYRAFPTYEKSKLANILHTYELARRLSAENSHVTVNCLHPGFVASGFAQNTNWLLATAVRIGQIFAISPENGAKTIIYLATAPEVSGVTGKYFVKCKEARSSAASHDLEAARRLWEISEKLVQPKS